VNERDPAGEAAAFLERIETDRRARLAQLDAELRTALAQVLRAARHESRARYHEQVRAARAEQEQLRESSLSRVRADIRRRRWQLLSEARKQALERLEESARATWSDVRRQGAWCRHWIDRALASHGEAALRVRLAPDTDAGVEREVRAQLEAANAKFTLERDAGCPPGLIVEWGPVMLDGTLAARCRAAEDELFGELTGWLHGEVPR